MRNVTARAGLMGWPVEHSISPAMQNAAFRALGLAWHYDLLPVPPGQVGDLLAGLAARGYKGANVTVPHKQAVLPFLARIEGAARAIGAVNTLVHEEEGGWAGHNTDAAGFLAALREAGFEPAGASALVLGAGGAARAVVHALSSAGCRVAIHNRTPERAARLAEEMAPAGGRPPRAISLHEFEPDAVDLLVNATSLGMGAQAGASAWPEPLPLPARWTVYDLVYKPAETPFLSRAREAGATAVGGLGMLVHQGALAFELWTGQPAPLEVMRAAARRALEASPG
jgi:shikimate dehydrogenase